jgi:hypothetical protein
MLFYQILLAILSGVQSQAVTAALLYPKNSIPACSYDQTGYTIEYSIEYAALLSMQKGNNITIKLEFPQEYRMAVNIGSMPIQWNGNLPSFQVANTANPILTFSVPYSYMSPVNVLKILPSNQLITPFKTGNFSLNTTFSWLGGGPSTSSVTFSTSAPSLQVTSTLVTPSSGTTSCLDLKVEGCNAYSSSTWFRLTDGSSSLPTPTLVAVNQKAYSLTTANPSSLTFFGLGSSLSGLVESFQIRVCSVKTPRFVGIACGYQAFIGSDASELGSSGFCLQTTTPADAIAFKLRDSEFAILQNHDLVLSMSLGFAALSDDTFEVKLAPEFSLGKFSSSSEQIGESPTSIGHRWFSDEYELHKDSEC